jgi:hypothetical protein
MQTRCLKFATLFVVAASAAASFAATSGPSSTVVYVGGNDLVIKASDGKVLNYTVPAGYGFTDGGKPATLGQLKPGDKLTAPVATGTDPQVVATITVLKAKVYATAPPDGITLTTPQGAKDFTVPAGTTFVVGGKSLGLGDLASDVTIDATIITPAADDTATAAPDTPPLTGALLVVKTDDLPSAGTKLPLYGVIGFAMMLVGFAMTRFRRPVSAL